MKKTLSTLALIALSIVLISGINRSNGSPGKYTGSPLDGNNCTACHTGTASSVNWIQTDIPESGWFPGQTYNLTLTAQNAAALKMGFELTVENASEKVGTFVVSDNSSKLLAQNTSVTHTSAGTTPTNGAKTWNMQWTAPEEDKGNITFYAAFNAANGNGNTSGDEIFLSTLSFAQDQSTNAENTQAYDLKIFPNPAKEMVFLQTTLEISELAIYTMNGKNVFRNNTINNTFQKIDIGDLSPGNYLVKVHSKKKSFEQKLIVL